ncbi:hypothetical protein N9V95_00135 [bacterium]|nr:hypothetical protein [bacterium]
MSARKPLPRWADVALVPALNLTLAFLVSGLVVLAIGENPLEAVKIMIYGAFGYGDGLGYTLHFATNFVFAGLAFALASHAGQFNIGAEGQAYVAGLGAILVGLALGQTHWLLVMPLAMLAAAAIGGFWGFVPGYLAAKRGSHVVITTIMFNFIASALMGYLLTRVLKPVGQMAPESATVEVAARIPKLKDFWDYFGHSPVNLMVFVAINTENTVRAGSISAVLQKRISTSLEIVPPGPPLAALRGRISACKARNSALDASAISKIK